MNEKMPVAIAIGDAELFRSAVEDHGFLTKIGQGANVLFSVRLEVAGKQFWRTVRAFSEFPGCALVDGITARCFRKCYKKLPIAPSKEILRTRKAMQWALDTGVLK